ncbi:glycosyltransferase family 39 protein [Schizophyllum commune]
MEPTGTFRARRAPSPPKYKDYPLTYRQDHFDADERRAAASKGYAPGRKYFPPGGLHLTSGEWKLLLAIIGLACWVRLWHISWPNSVVFDEVHFGKFASKYIKTQYFMDVHPPLAKLLITLVAFVFGYDGHFDFKDIAKVYDDTTPYVAMRMLPGVLGVATVPLAYLTIRALDCRATTALLASVFIIFENAMVTQSRHILLDSPLIFFTALSIFFWVGFCNEDKHQPFTETWWAWLALSGLSLGAVLSCKWVGLFTVATVGFSTIYQLWQLLGDLRVPPRLFIKHFLARALCLIVIPILFYMSMFQIHFAILQSSGDGDGFMSSEFQHTLSGRHMADTFADVAIGSSVTIRHVNTQGGYLHSHPHNYPGGSKQQQVTLYPHRDSNNEWAVINATAEDWDAWRDEEDVAYLTHGTRIKLRHIQTQRNLHSHDIRPPVSDVDFQNEVSAYGMANFAGDANDDWIVEIERGDRRDKESYNRVRTLRTTFRLRHALQGCYLFSHKVKLPDWGWEQQEVTCNKNAVRDNSLWFVETNVHPNLPDDAPKVNYRLPGFLSKFWELQQVMWTTNQGLTDRHTFDSRPDSWPRLRRGINFWVKDHRQIYLIGNPMLWWLSTAAVLAYVTFRAFVILRAKRGYRDMDNSKVLKYDGLCGFLFMGWALHYFPFYLMGRQLFLHHYLPALYFAILLLCVVFDVLTSTLRTRYRLGVAALLLLVAIANFNHLSPLAYGTPWTKKQCESARWLKTWDFSCNDFFDDYAKYETTIPHTPQKSSVATVGGEPGGRAPIVVHEEKPADEEPHTSAIGAKVEPGRNIFNEEKKDVKSAAAPERVEVVQEEKQISSVLTNQGEGGAKQPEDAPAQEQGKEKVEDKATVAVVAEGTTQEAPAEDAKVEQPAAAERPAEAEEKKEAGPAGEAEVEADRVAQELYPEAADAAA